MGQVLPDNQNDGIAQQRIEPCKLAREPAASMASRPSGHGANPASTERQSRSRVKATPRRRWSRQAFTTMPVNQVVNLASPLKLPIFSTSVQQTSCAMSSACDDDPVRRQAMR